jgi:hypothetical protein
MYVHDDDDDDDDMNSVGSSLSATGSKTGGDDSDSDEEGKNDAHPELYSMESLESVVEALKPMLKPVQTVLLFGCTSKLSGPPDSSSVSRLKYLPDQFKTCVAKSDVTIVNPHAQNHILHLRKSALPDIYKKMKSCDDDPVAMVAALKALDEKSSIWVTKYQSQLSTAARKTSHTFTYNFYEKSSALVDVLFTASQTGSEPYALLLSETGDMDTDVNIFNLSILKHDKHGMKAFFLNDLQKVLFGAGVTSMVVLNMSGIIDDSSDSEEAEPVSEKVASERLDEVNEGDDAIKENRSDPQVPVHVDDMDNHVDEETYVDESVADEEKNGTTLSVDELGDDEPVDKEKGEAAASDREVEPAVTTESVVTEETAVSTKPALDEENDADNKKDPAESDVSMKGGLDSKKNESTEVKKKAEHKTKRVKTYLQKTIKKPK